MKENTLTLQRSASKETSAPFMKVFFAKKAIYIIAQILCGGLALLMARCTVFKYCSPFALAFCCAVPIDFSPMAIVGSAAGFLLSGYEIVPLRYLCALLIIIVMRRLFFSTKYKDEPLAAGICGIFSTISTGLVTALILDEINSTLLIYLLESFIVGASSVFLSQGARTFKEMKSLRQLKDRELICLLLSAFLVLLSLGYISVYSFSPSGILCAVIVFLGAYYGKTGGGAIAGMGAGVAMSLVKNNPYLFICYSLGGLLAGLGAVYNKFFSVIAMLLSGGIIAIITAGKQITLINIAEIAIAGLIYFAIPKKILKKLSFLEGETYSVSAKGASIQAASKLSFASNALGDVSASVKSVHDKLEKLGGNKKTSIYHRTVERTCNKCGLKYYCWQQQKEYMVKVFKKVEKMLENGEELTTENLPNNLGATCIRSKALIRNFTISYNDYITNTLAEKRIDDVRNVMAVQFDALSQLLYDLSDDIENKEILDTSLTASVREILEYYEVNFDNAVVVANSDFKLKIAVTAQYKQDAFFKKEMIKDFNDLCGRHFSEPEIAVNDTSVMASYYEKTLYQTNVGFCQLNAENNLCCGDAFEILKDAAGRSVVILSDGMGNGGYARVDGAMASGMLAKLIGAGFSVGAAIKVVNSALMVKSPDESFATVDMIETDLFNGKTDFYKAGATCSFVKRRGKVGRIELASLPIGILKEADFAHTSLTLSEGDKIILVSDGATQGNYDWLPKVINAFPDDGSPHSLAKLIASEASKHQYGVHEDDITVIAIFIENK